MNKFLPLSALCTLVLLAACGGTPSSANPSENSTTSAATSAPAPTIAAPTDTSATGAPATEQPPASTDQSSAAPTPASSEPTRVFATGADPQTVVQAFFDAVNAKRTDAALALVDDNVDYALGNDHGSSKADLQAFLAKNTLTYTITNIVFDKTTDALTLPVKVSDGTTLRGAATVEDGKITTIMMGSVPANIN